MNYALRASSCDFGLWTNGDELHFSQRIEDAIGNEKIVDIADFPGVDELRNVAKKDLNKAVLLGFDNTINHLIEQHLSIYPLTILGRNDVLKSCK